MKAILALPIAVLLAGCQATHHHGPSHAAHAGGPAMTVPSEEARAAALAAADFDRAAAVRIELRDQGFTPQTLRLEAGKPYRMTVENIGGFAHYLNAPEFLRSIAAHHVAMRGEVEVHAPYFTRFEVARRGGQFQIEFVPLVRGVFRAYCHLEGDEHRGVEGRIIVE
jgi:hypothetical protein